MTLYMVEARSSRGELLSLPLDDISDGFLVSNIEGTGQVKASLVSSSFAGTDGEQYHSARLPARDIKIQIELHPDYITTTVDDLRDRLYDFFSTKSKVDLRFYNSKGLVVDISGIVEDCDNALFSKEPAMDISVRCFKPEFIDPNTITIPGMSTDTADELLIYYAGNADNGIQFDLHVNRTLNEFTIYHRTPENSLRSLDFAAPLSAGDVLSISTVTGAKGVTLTRDGSASSLLRGMSPQSNWIQFMKGDNHIRVYAVGAEIPYTIKYITKYGAL